MSKKSISAIGVFSIASGAMISSGIFILPGVAFAKVGPAIFISYFIAGVLGMLGIFSIIELSTAMPKAGGDYFFINKTFGPLVGTVSGFLGWLALSLKSSFAIFGIAEIIYLYTGINLLISALVLTLFFVALNIKGVEEAVIFQIAMVGGLFTLMILFVGFGLPKVETSHFSPLITGGINDVLITAGFVFISFGGLINVANISEEVKNPKRNIPLGMISSIAVVTIFYTLMTFVITGTLDAEAFKASLTPVADSARTFLGMPGYIFIIVASMLAFFTTANAGVMAASRYPMALSRDSLVPEIIAKTRKGIPIVSIIITGTVIYLSLLLPLELLVKAASTVILTSYVLTNLSVIVLRESRITNYRPSFRAPFYPWLQIASVIVFSFFIIDLGLDAIEFSLALLFISFGIYFFYGRKLKSGEYALLHLLKRITDNRLTEDLLEDELREIIVSRDDIEQDSFDQLVRDAQIYDIEQSMDFEALLGIVTKGLSPLVDVPEKELIRLFLDRQEESNTALSDFWAIPHVILDGEDKMFLAVVRAQSGIRFTENEPEVRAIFFLGGTKEKRGLHLKSLASIATLVGMDDFRERWLSAESITEIKNLLILSNRKRFT